MLPLQRKPAALEILTMIVIEKNRKHLRLRHHHFLFQEFPSYLVFDLFTLDMQKPINTYKIWHFYYPYDQMHGLYSPTFTPTNNPASKVVCINTMCIYTILYTTYMYIMYIYIIILNYTMQKYTIHGVYTREPGNAAGFRAEVEVLQEPVTLLEQRSHGPFENTEYPSSYDSFRTSLNFRKWWTTCKKCGFP